MNNIYAEILKRVENNEALTLKTEFTGSEGIMAESLKKTLAPYEPHTDMRGRCFADVTFEESDDGHSVAGEPFSPPERLIVLGAGHIALPVCEFAAKADLKCMCAMTGLRLQMRDASPMLHRCCATALKTA